MTDPFPVHVLPGWPPRRALCLALGFALAVGLGLACQSAPPALEAPAVSSFPRWPPEPARARIRWLAEVRGPEDLGIRPGPLRRLWNWISGRGAPLLVRPHGVAVDPRGRLWVTDPGARRVHVFDPNGRRYRSLPGKGVAPFLSPIAVTHDPSGVAYVSDSARRVIRRFDPKGRFLGDWDGAGEFVRPTGVAFDAHTGLLWVADTGSHRLLALNGEGRIRRSIGQRGRRSGRFNFPTHLAIGPDGRLFVTDTLNFRIQVFSREGEPLASIGKPGDGPGFLSKPKGVAIDADRHIYVVDALFDNVQIFDLEGRVLLHFGDHGAGPGQFWIPAGLCVAGNGRIYVADAYNQRIQVFEYLGE